MILKEVQLRNDASNFLSGQLEMRIPETKDDILRSELIQRYISCLSLEETPSLYVLQEYVFSQNQDFDMAARSCEFYGGIKHEHLDSRRHILNLRDFENLLSLSYIQLSKSRPCLSQVYEKTKEVLAAYRQTTHYLENNDKVITLIPKN